MTDPGAPADGAAGAAAVTGARSGTLGLRLALLGVALAAVALLAGLTAAFASADVSNLVTQQRTDLARAAALAAGVVYDRNDSWSSADLSLVTDQAAGTGAAVEILDQDGT